jgi:Fe2+ or Zn2+ uptake regulation protein
MRETDILLVHLFSSLTIYQNLNQDESWQCLHIHRQQFHHEVSLCNKVFHKHLAILHCKAVGAGLKPSKSKGKAIPAQVLREPGG